MLGNPHRRFHGCSIDNSLDWKVSACSMPVGWPGRFERVRMIAYQWRSGVGCCLQNPTRNALTTSLGPQAQTFLHYFQQLDAVLR